MPLIQWTSIYVTHSSQNFYLLFLLLPARPLARLPAILQLLLVFRKHFTYHLATVSCVFIYTMLFYTYEDKCMSVWRIEVIVSIEEKQANHAKSRAKPHPWRMTLRHIETWEICGVKSKCNLNRRKPLFVFVVFLFLFWNLLIWEKPIGLGVSNTIWPVYHYMMKFIRWIPECRNARTLCTPHAY